MEPLLIPVVNNEFYPRWFPLDLLCLHSSVLCKIPVTSLYLAGVSPNSPVCICLSFIPSNALPTCCRDLFHTDKGAQRVCGREHVTHLLHMCRGPRSSPCMLFGWWFSLCEPPWAQVSWLCRFSCIVLDPSGSYNPSSPSSEEFPKLCLLFGCGSLHLFPLTPRGSLSDFSFSSHVWFYPRSLS